MPAPIFYFDFGSPNAYLVHRVLPSVERSNAVRFRYMPVLLGGLFKLTGNRSPMIAYADIPAKLAYEHLETARFIRRHNLTAFRMNPFFPVNTLMLMRGAVAAEMDGLATEYIEAMFHFMWEEPRKLDDRSIFEATLTDAGLPADRLLARIDDAEVKDRLVANTQMAFERGAFGIPSFLVGDELFFGKDRLADVQAELMLHRPFDDLAR